MLLKINYNEESAMADLKSGLILGEGESLVMEIEGYDGD